jgi:hypothetical protein
MALVRFHSGIKEAEEFDGGGIAALVRGLNACLFGELSRRIRLNGRRAIKQSNLKAAALCAGFACGYLRFTYADRASAAL